MVEIKLTKKFYGAQIWVKQAKIRFFAIFSSLVHLVFLEIAYNYSLQQCLTSGWGKSHEKDFGGPNLCQKLCLKIGFSPFSNYVFSHVWFISFLLNCIGW